MVLSPTGRACPLRESVPSHGLVTDPGVSASGLKGASGALPSVGGSEEAHTVGHGPFGADQYDRAVRVGETQHEHFGHERPDLLRRKVDHGRDLTPDQSF